MDFLKITYPVRRNDPRSAGIALCGLYRKHGLELIHEDDKKFALESFLASVRDEVELSHREIRKTRKDGNFFWAKETVRLMRNAGGTLLELIVLELLPVLANQSPPIPAIVFSGQEVNPQTACKLDATLVKPNITNEKLLDTVQSSIRLGNAALKME